MGKFVINAAFFLRLILSFYFLSTVSCYDDCGQVHLTVSASKTTHLELNWITDCNQLNDEPDLIALYGEDITNRIFQEEQISVLLKINASDYPAGYYETDIEFGFPELPGNWEYKETLTSAQPGLQCYPYWIVSFKGDTLIDVRCLGIEPTWMNDNKLSIGTSNLRNLFFPGTHDSGSFSGVPDLIEGYVLTQDRSIWHQLVHGMRYLDLRIAYYENEGFYINHNFVRLMKVEPIFEQIRKYTELAPKEVVIIDFHRFPYPSDFNSSLHDEFISLVRQHFGEVAFQRGDKYPSLNDIWEQKKNLVIFYGNSDKVAEYDWLWPPLPQLWGDTNEVDVLKDYLSEAIEDNDTGDSVFALMSELTPQIEDILLLKNDLRKLANDVNRNVTRWFRDEWANETSVAAVDYFLGTDVINVAIRTNNNKYQSKLNK